MRWFTGGNPLELPTLGDRGERILNVNTFEIPARIKEFRRGPDVLRRGESKAQDSAPNPWSKSEIAVLGFEDGRGGGGEKRIEVRAPPPPSLYIGRLSGTDDPGRGWIIQTWPESSGRLGRMIRGRAGSSGFAQKDLGRRTRWSDYGPDHPGFTRKICQKDWFDDRILIRWFRE